MIEVSPITAMMLYLGLTLSVLLSIWVIQHYRSRRKKIILADQELFVCEYCHFTYLDGRSKKVTKCPQCQAYNKNNVFNSSVEN